MTKTPETTVPAKMANAAILPPAPVLKSGDDKAVAHQLTELYDDAHNGMRKIIALGLFAWEIKENQLKHGQFGAWLAANCPKLAHVDEQSGKAFSSRALRGYMDLTKNVLESVGFKTVGKFLGTAAKLANDANLGHGQFLLVQDSKVPETLKETRDKICALVDGKTQRALFTEFKQAEDDEEGNAKVKRGRNKGSSGLTKEQRERAAARAEIARIEELDEQAGETAAWLVENSDDKNLGQLDTRTLNKLLHATDVAAAYLKRVLNARKSK